MQGAPITADADLGITRIGRVLRRAKIDEVPQLLNVLKGDMSLVGPRPAVGQFSYLFDREYRELLQVRPGIIDLAWLTYRDEAAALTGADDAAREYVTRILPKKLKLSKEYLGRASFWFDLLLMIRALLVFGESIVLPRTLDTREIHVRQAIRSVLRYRRALVVGFHLVLIVAANYLAFWLRFDGDIPRREMALFVTMLPWLIALRGLTFIPFRLYEGLWKYTGIWDLRNIVAGVFSSTGLFAVALAIKGHAGYPRSVFVVDSILLIFLMGGSASSGGSIQKAYTPSERSGC